MKAPNCVPLSLLQDLEYFCLLAVRLPSSCNVSAPVEDVFRYSLERRILTHSCSRIASNAINMTCDFTSPAPFSTRPI